MINQIRQTLLRVPRVRYYTATTLRRTYKRASPVVKPKATTTTTTITTTKPAIRSIATEVTTPKEEAELVEAEETKPVEVNTSNRMSLHDAPLEASIVQTSGTIDWSDSFHGLGSQPFSKEIADILLADVDVKDIEIKPDGLLYLPEIKYRRILNRAFGPGGWGLAPRTETYITPRQISREYGLICHGRLVSIARGEQDYFGGEDKITTALEGCKSNALMRCCKDLGIASELWDPSFIRAWKSKNCEEIFVEHITKKTKRRLWKLKSNKEMPAGYKKA